MATRVAQVPEPKHKVFLSHSGAQKDFVDQLCVDLERVSYIPFFDRRQASLEKGATFPGPIFDAVRQCRLFVLVLSEEYFCQTKWPMLELVAAVNAQSENPNLKLLPLFFKISLPEFKVEERRANWFKLWTDWASETSRIDVKKWKEALKVVEVWNGIEFPAGAGEVKYRKLVVETVCRICPNNVFDVSRVVGRERFCQILSHKFEEIKRETQCDLKAPQIGVFGMGGLGKTTLCKVMCNHYFADFGGNVIHIDLKLNTIMENQKKVIGKLTGATQAITDPDEGHLQLKMILSMHKVFLALDNVTDDWEILEEVLWYLSVSYAVGSMILVTSRSLEVLLSELQIRKCHCLEVPDLNESEAISLFLQAGPSNKHLELSCYSDEEQLRVVEGVQRALFTRKLRSGEQFHPLALKALASRLGKLINKPEQWQRTLATLDLKFTQYNVHPIFSILGSSFEMLPQDEKLIFMDVALFKPSCVIVEEDVCKWLSLVHQLPYDDIEEHLRSLQTKSLLEEDLGDEETKPIIIDEGATTSIEALGIGGLQEMNLYLGRQVVVHDLYADFVKLECKSNSLDKIQCFVHENCDDVPCQMQGFPSRGPCWPMKRIALIRGSLHSLSECKFGEYYKNVQVLRFEYLTALIDLNIEGMFCLASVDILCCYKLRNIHGLQTLKRLAWLRVARCEMLEALPNLEDLSLLEHVEVRNSSTEICPLISSCPHLYELRLSGHYAIKDLSPIKALKGLRKVMIEWCPKLCTLPMLQDFGQLCELYVLDCPDLGGVMEVGSLVTLRKLHLRWINITELGGVGLMRDLCQLVCEQCPLLHKLSDKIGALTKLTLLGLSYCPELGGVLTVGSLLALQKLHLRSIAVTVVNGVGKLRCLREFVWTCAQTSIPKLHGSCELSDVSELTGLKVLNIEFASQRSFTFDNFRPLQRIRNFLQGEVHCDIGDVNHVMQIMTQHAMISGNAQDSQPMVVGKRVWSFMMVQNAIDVVEEFELDNDVMVHANKISSVTVRNLELQTTVRFFYGVSLDHVNECVPGMGSPMRIVSFTEDMFQGRTKAGMSTLYFSNIAALYLEDLEIGHLQLIGMNYLSTLYILRCKRLLAPVILEAMMALEDVKMEDCEYLDDDCSALRIRECIRLRVVTITQCKKMRPVFISKVRNCDDFQNLPFEDISNVQSSIALLPTIEWFHNMHVKVNIGWCRNILMNHLRVHSGVFDATVLLLLKLYIFGDVPAYEYGWMKIMRRHVCSNVFTNFRGHSCGWTCMVLQSTSTLSDESFMSKFDAIPGRSRILKIAMEFADQDFELRLCFLYGVLCEQVLQYLPDNWIPIRIVSFTGDKFQILNQEIVSKRLGNITTLHLTDIEIKYRDLSELKCLVRLHIRNGRDVRSSPIILDNMLALEYVKLAELDYHWCGTALEIRGCPQLQEVTLHKCLNVCFVFITGKACHGPRNKLIIIDCLDVVDIYYSQSNLAHFPKVIEVTNCPLWQSRCCRKFGRVRHCPRERTLELPGDDIVPTNIKRCCPKH